MAPPTRGERYPWDAPARPSWEEGNADPEDDGDLEEPTGDAAGQVLLELLLDMQATRAEMSGKAICLIAYWATRSGALGIAHAGFRPGAPSGHYQRHLDATLGVKVHDPRNYQIDIPCHTKHDLSRQVRQTIVRCPHEALHDELAAVSTETLVQQIADAEFGSAYWQHPVVLGAQASGQPVVPLSIYMDAVPF